MEKRQNYIAPIIVTFMLFGMIAFVSNLSSPMGDILSHQFNIPNWQGTLGVFANFIAYAMMGYPAGALLHRFGYKRTSLLAIAVGLVGVGIQTLSGYLESFGTYLMGAFVAGFSMCMLNTVVNPMLNRLGGGGNRGNQMIQYAGTLSSLCGTAVIILTGLLIPSGIRQAAISNTFPLMYTALAVFAVAFVVMACTDMPERETPSQEGESRAVASPLSYRHFVYGAVAIFIYVGVEVGTPNVMNKWLQNPDLHLFADGINAEAVAASVAATYWLLMLVGRLLGGLVANRISARRMLTAAALGALALVLGAIIAPLEFVHFPAFYGAQGFGMVQIPLSAALLACVGLCTSVMWGAIFNLAVEGLGVSTEKASGIFMALVCGGGVLPLIQNGIVDITGRYLTSYWLVVAGFAYILFFALRGSKIREA